MKQYEKVMILQMTSVCIMKIVNIFIAHLFLDTDLQTVPEAMLIG